MLKYTKNFNKLDKAFDFCYLQYEQTKDINMMFEILNISIVLYIQSGEKYEAKKQDNIFSNLFLVKINDLELQNLLFVLNYEITVRQNSKDILPIVNQYILEKDINGVPEQLKIILSDFYLQTEFTFPNYQKIFLAENNICYEKDGFTYVDNKYIVSEENQKLWI